MLLLGLLLGLFRPQRPKPMQETETDNPIGASVDAYFDSLQKDDELTGHYYLDKSDEGLWLIKHSFYGVRFTAGRNKPAAQSVVFRLNQAHRPNVEQFEPNVLHICFNFHEKGEKCEFEIINLN